MAPRLLFDENLAARLVGLLRAEYPGSIHVRDAIGPAAPDERIWEYARAGDLVIVSKDSDFHQRSFLEGPPPKVLWIQRGNCTTAEIEALLRASYREVLAFVQDEAAAFLALA